MQQRWTSRIALGLAALGLTCALGWPALAREKTFPRESRLAELRLRADVSYLASDQLEGRGPTTEGLKKAAEYIAESFQKIGLKPATSDKGYFQPFQINGSRLLRPATLSLKGPKGQVITLKEGVHFQPMGLSYTGSFNNIPIVFAGYGITTTEDPKYDDYQGLDVAGKLVIVLRDTPGSGNRFLPFAGRNRARYGSLTEKMVNAEKRDALGMLFVNTGEIAREADDLLNFGFTAVANRGSPQQWPKVTAYHVRRSLVDSMLTGAGQPALADLEQAIDRDQKPLSRPLNGWSASFDVKVERGKIDQKNVVGVLEGKGPLANETVVVGAHYDHLGMGGTSSLSGLPRMAIHNGADDNASGTSALIELARRFADNPDRQGRRMVFIAFSAEELGLFGSVHYCKNPLFPLDKTVAMVNLDMVGRLQKDAKTGEERLQIHGTGTAKEFASLVDRLAKPHGLTIRKIASGFGPSDHSSFYEKKIPVLFFFTGDHEDYHRPSDDTERLNFDGLRRVTELTEEVCQYLTTVTPGPAYIEVQGGGGTGPRPSVRLGIRPEYVEDMPGVTVGGVSSGDPAARAGIKQGDRIVTMNGQQIKDIQSYMVFMGGRKPGETIEVGVIREGKTLSLKVKLD